MESPITTLRGVTSGKQTSKLRHWLKRLIGRRHRKRTVKSMKAELNNQPYLLKPSSHFLHEFSYTSAYTLPDSEKALLVTTSPSLPSVSSTASAIHSTEPPVTPVIATPTTMPVNSTQLIPKLNDRKQALINELKKDTLSKDTIAKTSRQVSSLSFKIGAFGLSGAGEEELLLLREIFELEAWASFRLRDFDGFRVAFDKLLPLYIDFEDRLPASERMYEIFAVYLLYLLTVDSFGEFSSILGLLDVEKALENQHIVFARNIEHALNEGRYPTVWRARSHVPNTEYVYFIDKIIESVRKSIAESFVETYKHLSVSAAQGLLFFDNDRDFLRFMHELGWEISPNDTHLRFPAHDDAPEPLDNMGHLKENLELAAFYDKVE